MQITESVGYAEIAEKAGLYEMKEFREVQKVKEKCSSKMEKLLMLQREVEA